MRTGFMRYRASKLDCDACTLKPRCCPNAPARKILRSIHEGARDMARDIAATDAYVTSRRQRKKVEMLFAHLKRILKLDRLRLRGPNGARDEFHLAAAAQNLRKLAKLIPMRHAETGVRTAAPACPSSQGNQPRRGQRTLSTVSTRCSRSSPSFHISGAKAVRSGRPRGVGQGGRVPPPATAALSVHRKLLLQACHGLCLLQFEFLLATQTNHRRLCESIPKSGLLSVSS